MLQGGAELAPAILSHPLEEVQQIMAEHNGKVADARWQTGERLLWSSGQLPYAVSFNEVQLAESGATVWTEWCQQHGGVSKCHGPPNL